MCVRIEVLGSQSNKLQLYSSRRTGAIIRWLRSSFTTTSTRRRGPRRMPAIVTVSFAASFSTEGWHRRKLGLGSMGMRMSLFSVRWCSWWCIIRGWIKGRGHSKTSVPVGRLQRQCHQTALLISDWSGRSKGGRISIPTRR